jgi:hypothetical protein
MEFSITVRDFLSIAGISVFVALVVQWLKEWITEVRLLNLVALVIALVTALLAQCVIAEWKPSGEQIFAAVLIGFFAASASTLGYEVIQNIRGLTGKGSRA